MTIWTKFSLLLLLLHLAILSVLRAQNTSLIDSTFGVNGLVKSDFLSQTNGFIYKVLVQPDGKIISVGLYFTYSHRTLFVMRYNPDGTLDQNFGENGKTDISNFQGKPISFSREFMSATLQPDGKIVIVSNLDYTANSYLLRLNPDGKPDSSFGTNGVLLVELYGSAHLIWLSSVVCQSNNRLVAAGIIQFPGAYQQGILIGLDEKGGLDPSFGNNGRVVIDYFTENIVIRGLKLQPDGKILFCGDIRDQNSLLGRYNPDGTPDATFNGDGFAVPVGLAPVQGIAQFPDGKILISGRKGSQYQLGLYQFSADGKVDHNFGNSGGVVVPGLYCDLLVKPDIEALPDGKILAAGSSAVNQDNLKLLLSRLEPSGEIDFSFGNSGYFDPQHELSYWGSSSFTRQPDGKILMGCSFSRPGGLEAIVTRALPEGVPDSSFNGTGSVIFSPRVGYQIVGPTLLLSNEHTLNCATTKIDDLKSGYTVSGILQEYDEEGNRALNFGGTGIVLDTITPVAAGTVLDHIFQRPGGNILVMCESTYYVDSSTNMSVYTAFLNRYYANGLRDSTFFQTGTLVFPGGPYKEALSFLGASLPDEKLMVFALNGKQLNMIRLNQDDMLDSTFGNNGFLTLNLPESIGVITAAVQQDGKILLAGTLEKPAYDYLYGVLRLTPDGAIDTSWGNGKGYITNRYKTAKHSHANCMAVQADGKVMIAGYYYDGGSNKNVAAMARFNADGSLDKTFGNNGNLILPTSLSSSLVILTIAPMDNGKFFTAGQYVTTLDYESLAMRHNPDGTLDSTFGEDGLLHVNLGFGFEQVDNILFPSNGKILAAGEAQDVFFLLRLLPDLQVDASDLHLQPGNLLVYPNPIRQQTILKYTLPEPSPVSLELFDQQGRLVQELLSAENRPAGEQLEHLQFSSGLAAGIYTLRLRTDSGQAAIRIVLAP